jgi:hypothetical protein
MTINYSSQTSRAEHSCKWSVPQHLRQPQPLRLPPVQDRFHNVGRQAGERQEPADIGVRDALLLRQVGDRSRVPALDPPPPAVRSNQRLDQGLVAACLPCRRGCPLGRHDQLPAAAALQSHRDAEPGTMGRVGAAQGIFNRARRQRAPWRRPDALGPRSIQRSLQVRRRCARTPLEIGRLLECRLAAPGVATRRLCGWLPGGDGGPRTVPVLSDPPGEWARFRQLSPRWSLSSIVHFARSPIGTGTKLSYARPPSLIVISCSGLDHARGARASWRRAASAWNCKRGRAGVAELGGRGGGRRNFARAAGRDGPRARRDRRRPRRYATAD